MYLINPKIQQLLINKHMFTQVDIDNMIRDYTFSVYDLIVDEVQIFIEQKKLTHIENYIRSIADEIKKKPRSTVDDQIKFYTEIFNVMKDYPELKAIVKAEIQKLDDALDKIVIDTLDDDGKLKLMDIFEADLKKIEIEEAAAKRIEASRAMNKP